VDFRPHRRFNGVKTALLFGALWALLLVVGMFVGSGRYLWAFAVAGVVLTIVPLWNCDKIAIRAMRAYPVTAQQQPTMHRIVSQLALEMRMPMPTLYVSPTPAPNAFATGRSPSRAAVCCTEGILDLLSERELSGVLGHELMHVRNRDILISSVAAALAGVLTSLAYGLMWYGAGSRGRGRDQRAIGAFASLTLIVLAPLAATIIQLAISRTREYHADEDSARATGDPLALANALAKLERGIDAAPLSGDPRLRNVSHLMIANPFRGGALTRLFSTHPPTEQRVARLRTMASGSATSR